SPDGVIVGPASKSARSQVASAVSWWSLPGEAMMATRCRPSELIDTDWMSGTFANASAGMGSTPCDGPATRQVDTTNSAALTSPFTKSISPYLRTTSQKTWLQ